ncbi:hypothetical protein, partial [Ralstonia pseudosolanacearum]|uniref:hypothetical protein n=1 Tax=Ralstonia pseudosolanacearum TaxID=1310165 RepID=UPI001E2C47C0
LNAFPQCGQMISCMPTLLPLSLEFACIFQGQTLSPQVLQSGIQLAETNINQTFEPAGWRSLTCRKQTPNNLSPIDCPD